MAHPEQLQFFDNLKRKFPEQFKNVRVIDCGSLDVCGSLKHLFEDCEYIGVDIVEGRNVDLVSKIHELPYKAEFDTVVSGEMLEHDEHWKASLKKMFAMTKPKGLMAFSAAGKNRPEHGTSKTTGTLWGTSPDYYMNIEQKHVEEALPLSKFSEYDIVETGQDIYFYGIKR